MERFNRTFRTEVLDRFVFTTLEQVRRMAEDWRHRYNHQRPHRPFGGLPPIRFAKAQLQLPLLLSDSKKRGRFRGARAKCTAGSLTMARANARNEIDTGHNACSAMSAPPEMRGH
ncbi:integrase core domain-containing protein [Xanthomonas vasicola]|uniref:integrase core domain-containing protein n=1 Tax=Xanthomonas vasicola TaxID=56459 RepID=UPI0038B1CB2E